MKANVINCLKKVVKSYFKNMSSIYTECETYGVNPFMF